NRVASALNSEADDVLGVEVDRVLCERRAGRMLNALINGEDRDVARVCKATRREQRLHRTQDLRTAVGCREDPVDEVRARQVQPALVDGLALVVEKRTGFVAEDVDDAGGTYLWHIGS